MTSAPRDILITGASGTIGAAFARRFAQRGFTLHLTARTPAKIAKLAAELRDAGAKVYVYPLQLNNLRRCRAVVQEFFRKAKNPSALICNAANLGVVDRYRDVDFKRWRASIDENFIAQAAMVHAFVRLFAKRRGRDGAIVLMSGSGLGGNTTFDRVSSYSAAKAAITHLAEALAPELSEIGLTINAIAPGQVVSGMTRQMLAAGKKAGAHARGAQASAAQGGVSPELAADLAEFLTTPAAQAISGRLLSARFDRATLQTDTADIAQDPNRYRLRRIDNALFGAYPR